MLTMLKNNNGTDDLDKVTKTRRFEDLPYWLSWLIVLINKVGFPIVVTIYLGWLQIQAIPKLAESINNVNATMVRVQDAIVQNTALLKEIRERRSYDRRHPAD